MGSRITELALNDKEFTLVSLLERESHREIGTERNNITISDNYDDIRGADCLIEFTLPDPTCKHLECALKHKKAMVIGTTGLTPEQKQKIESASREIPIVFSPNMSTGVNILFRLLKEASSVLKNYNTKIVEAHHIHKKDKPSGTAKKLAEIIKENSGKDPDNIESIREGEIVGDHEVIFDSPLDTIKLTHPWMLPSGL